MSALDDIITIYNVTSAAPLNGDDMQRVIYARAELTQLRDSVAALVTLKARCDELTEMAIGRDAEIERLHNAAEALQQQATEQARRITELEGAIDRAMAQIENGDIRLAWAILNNAYHPAPAPQAEQEQTR